MDRQKAKILYDLLKSTSTERTCKGLREIKKRLLTNPENLKVFRSLGLISQALKLIQRPNEEILNGALSILSGCCMDEEARREVFQEGGVTHIVNVLKCAKLEPLQQRVVRTLANQAQHKPSCEAIVRLRAVELVIEILEGCQEDETKVAGIRALRLFANCGEHCQKIITSKGILVICSAGFGSSSSSSSSSSPTSNLTRATVKAIAHFSRISHPTCISQIMEGTDNMTLMTKIMLDSTQDQEIYECVLRTVLNTVQSCFAPTQHKRDVLDAKVLDRLCTATAPSIIVGELKSRRVVAIEEDKLILALCKFCEGSSECNNLTFGSFSEPPTFLGRAWMQLIDCGGVAMLVKLLLIHRAHRTLRPALLRAILGVEHNYSYRDTILKHLLAAKLLPQLAEQFDELMRKYMEVRREPMPGRCIHTTQTTEQTAAGGGDDRGESSSSSGSRMDVERDTGKEEKCKGETEMAEGVDRGESSSSMEVEEDTGKEEKCKGKTEMEEEGMVMEVERDKRKEEDSKTESDKEVRKTNEGQETKANDGRTKETRSEPDLNDLGHEEKVPSYDLRDISKDFLRDYPERKLGLDFRGSERKGNKTEGTTKSTLDFGDLNPNNRNPINLEPLNTRIRPRQVSPIPVHPSSVSCSPRSPQSSPSYSPTLSEPTSPGASFPTPHVLPPWSTDTQHSPTASPPLSPVISSPVRSSSPIRVPSDWEYDDEEEEGADGGRFSPSVLESKLSELEESQGEEEEEEEEERLDKGLRIEDKEGVDSVSEEGRDVDVDARKRGWDSQTQTTAARKRVRVDSEGVDSANDTYTTAENDTRDVDMKTKDDSQLQERQDTDSKGEGPSHHARPSTPVKGEHEVEEEKKSPFVNLNQIKFRVRKKGTTRRQRNLRDVYTPIQDQQGMETKAADRQHHKEQQQQQHQQRGAKITRSRSESVCSSTILSDLSQEEAQSLELLELVVRVIGQVAHVKEAIKPVCREFVPRIMTYLSKVQVIHKSATRMLVVIARNTQSIQPLLDSLFIPYVGVELGEADDPESPNGCPQCKILSEGSQAFLDEMVNFFNHIHMYGQCEVSSRLHPARELAVREGCAVALPHITRCPKLLHDFMVCYPAIDLLMSVLHSSQPPDQASYMYATAALSRLASTLQLENHFKPVRCEVCYRRESHTKEEVTAQLKNKNMRCGQNQTTHTSTHTPTSPNMSPPTNTLDNTPSSTIPPSHTSTSTSTPVPIHSHTHQLVTETKDCCWPKESEEHDVIFKLKDGTTVSANRESLADRNEFLRGMLLGSFSEGSSSTIDLLWTSKESLEMMIHFLYGCRSCQTMQGGGMEAFIDLVLMSQMYLVAGLQSYAETRMISCINGFEDVIRIYESGVGRINENLVLWAICTVLVRPMKTWKRARWMKGLFQSLHAEDIDHNIRMILRHPLDMNRLVCTCNQSLSLYMVSQREYTKLC